MAAPVACADDTYFRGNPLHTVTRSVVGGCLRGDRYGGGARLRKESQSAHMDLADRGCARVRAGLLDRKGRIDPATSKYLMGATSEWPPGTLERRSRRGLRLSAR